MVMTVIMMVRILIVMVVMTVAIIVTMMIIMIIIQTLALSGACDPRLPSPDRPVWSIMTMVVRLELLDIRQQKVHLHACYEMRRV